MSGRVAAVVSLGPNTTVTIQIAWGILPLEMVTMYSKIINYRPELDILMVVSPTPDKYILRWPEHRHELVMPICDLLGGMEMFREVHIDNGFHIAIIEFAEEFYWRVNTLINEIGVFIQWNHLTKK